VSFTSTCFGVGGGVEGFGAGVFRTERNELNGFASAGMIEELITAITKIATRTFFTVSPFIEVKSTIAFD
jgi:hypothetical protein